ncbi:hypothetical protein [Kordia jejudonensis]|uniref:hypothetical protein n=1 Tax=Kordia jejudonensis TaxID=1348245 RepID=UPI0009E58004|nr:hypothetical protein [Kordia jejudonensis]
MKRCLFSLIVLVLFIHCKSISVHQKPQLITETPVALGSIGLIEDNILNKHFEGVSVPVFSEPLPLNVQSAEFNKQTFKAFAKANSVKKKIAISFEDSLQVKPQYVQLQLSDRVSVLNQLNDSRNAGVRSYLENKEDAQLVTSITIAFTEENLQKIAAAEEVFLIQSSSKKFSLQLKNQAGTTEQIQFSDGIIFAYRLSGFCWKENEKHRLVIGDIISSTESCPRNTYKKASKVIQKEDYFKI